MNGLSPTGQNLNDTSFSALIEGDRQEAATWRVCVELDRIVVELDRLNAAVERLTDAFAKREAA